jgi:hypothetical protein
MRDFHGGVRVSHPAFFFLPCDNFSAVMLTMMFCRTACTPSRTFLFFFTLSAHLIRTQRRDMRMQVSGELLIGIKLLPEGLASPASVGLPTSYKDSAHGVCVLLIARVIP